MQTSLKCRNFWLEQCVTRSLIRRLQAKIILQRGENNRGESKLKQNILSAMSANLLMISTWLGTLNAGLARQGNIFFFNFLIFSAKENPQSVENIFQTAVRLSLNPPSPEVTCSPFCPFPMLQNVKFWHELIWNMKIDWLMHRISQRVCSMFDISLCLSINIQQKCFYFML